MTAGKLVVFAIAVLGSAPPALAQATARSGAMPPQSPTQGEFVLLRRGDTIRVERFTSTGRVLRSEILSEDNERDDVTAWIGAGGYVDSLLIIEIDGTDRWSQHTVFTDSLARVTTSSGGKTTVVSTPFASRPMPFYGPSLALMQALTRQAPRQRTRTVPGIRGASLRSYTLSRSGDTVLVADGQRLLWLALGTDGTILGGRTLAGDVIVRRRLARFSPLPVAHGSTRWFVDNGGHQIGKCRVSEHSYPPSPIAIQLEDTVEGAPAHLRSDGRGAYTSGIDGVLAHVVPLMELYAGGHPLRRPPPTPNRTVTYNLSRPVVGSGSQSLGVVPDARAAIAVFYRKDPGTDVILSPKEMAVGEEVRAARLELGVHLGGEGNGNLSTLSFGPFPRGYCEEALIVQTNAGTTQPMLKRTSSTTWLVDIPPGSIGRLWYDISGEASADGKTQDRGLFYFSGRFQFSLIPQ